MVGLSVDFRTPLSNFQPENEFPSMEPRHQKEPAVILTGNFIQSRASKIESCYDNFEKNLKEQSKHNEQVDATVGLVKKLDETSEFIKCLQQVPDYQNSTRLETQVADCHRGKILLKEQIKFEEEGMSDLMFENEKFKEMVKILEKENEKLKKKSNEFSIFEYSKQHIDKNN